MNTNPGYDKPFDYRMLPRRTRSGWFQRPFPRELSLRWKKQTTEEQPATADEERNRLVGNMALTRRDEEGRLYVTRLRIQSKEDLELLLRQAGLILDTPDQADPFPEPRYFTYSRRHGDPSWAIQPNHYQPVSQDWFRYHAHAPSFPQDAAPYRCTPDPAFPRFRWRYDPHHQGE